jgi:hypothetical protein
MPDMAETDRFEIVDGTATVTVTPSAEMDCLFLKICGYDSVKSRSMAVRCSVQHIAIAD